MDKKKLAIVVPCYNEEESLSVNIDVFKHTLFALIEKGVIKDDSFICFIDDGSKDKTWELIEKAHGVDFAHIKGLRFTKNYGNQKALIAGLEYALKKALIVQLPLMQICSRTKLKLKNSLINLTKVLKLYME